MTEVTKSLDYKKALSLSLAIRGLQKPEDARALIEKWCALDHQNIDLFDSNKDKIPADKLLATQVQVEQRKDVERKLKGLLGEDVISDLKSIATIYTVYDSAETELLTDYNTVHEAMEFASGKIGKYSDLVSEAIKNGANKQDIEKSLSSIVGFEKFVDEQIKAGNYPEDKRSSEEYKSEIAIKERDFLLKLNKAGGFEDAYIQHYEWDAGQIGHKDMAVALLSEMKKPEISNVVAVIPTTPPASTPAAPATPETPAPATAGGATGDTGHAGEPAPAAEPEAKPEAKPSGLTEAEVKELQDQVGLLNDRNAENDKGTWGAIKEKLAGKGIVVKTDVKAGEFVSTVASQDLARVVETLSVGGIDEGELEKIGDAMNTVDSRSKGSQGIIAAGGSDVDKYTETSFAPYDLEVELGKQRTLSK